MMNAQDMTELADPWVLSTYRRLDVLEVPAFSLPDTSALVPPRRSRPARLRRLPTALPREIQSLMEWLDGMPAEGSDLPGLVRLSLLLRYLASPLRFEPDNVYQVHRAVPSARCLFPIDLLLSQTAADGTCRTYRYHPDFHALERLDAAELRGGSVPEASLTLTAIGRFWKLVRKYGDFSPFPVMLEAGMLLAQLRLLRCALGWGGSAGDPEAMRGMCEGDLERPLFAETLLSHDIEIDIESLPTCEVILAEHVLSTTGMPQFRHLMGFMDLFDRASGPAAASVGRVGPGTAPPTGWLPRPRGLLETCRLRHSANDRSGMAPRVDGEPDLPARLAYLSCRIASRRQPVPGEQHLQVRMIWPGRVAPQTGIYDGHGRLLSALDRRHLTDALNRALPSPELRYNLQAHSVLILFLTDPDDRHMAEPWAFRDAHLAAGARAQDYCLAAAALDRFARPLRMLQEQVLEPLLAGNGKIIYSLLCGSSRATNVCAELL